MKSALFIAFAAFTLGTAASAETISIFRCPTVISQPGDYALAQNIQCTDSLQTAITIQNTRSVRLSFAGHSITGVMKPNFGGKPAIFVENSSAVSIDGTGGRIDSFTNGISLDKVNNFSLGAAIQKPFVLNARDIGIQGMQDTNVLLSNVYMLYPAYQGLMFASVNGFKAYNINVNSQQDTTKVTHTGINFSDVSNGEVVGMVIRHGSPQPIMIQQGSNMLLKNIQIADSQSYEGIEIGGTTNYKILALHLDKAALPMALTGNNSGLVVQDTTWGTGLTKPNKFVCYFGATAPNLPTFLNTPAPALPLEKCQ
ncbi:MAG: hypothetical protein ACXVCG_16800 [Bdellovibrionota bacterium]